MTFSITPIVGVRINEINPPTQRFTVGTVITHQDGHDYIFARASGAIGANAACVLTEPAMTMAAGAGAWTSPNFGQAMVLNDTAWFRKTAI
jgi:hypothetical protein